MRIPNSVMKALENNPIDVVFPEPKTETRQNDDGSFSMVVGYDMSETMQYIKKTAQHMTDNLDYAIIDEFARLNGYVKRRTCSIVWNDVDDTWECSNCGSAVGHPGVNYCEECGAEATH